MRKEVIERKKVVASTQHCRLEPREGVVGWWTVMGAQRGLGAERNRDHLTTSAKTRILKLTTI
jgi:hypothetical protein